MAEATWLGDPAGDHIVLGAAIFHRPRDRAIFGAPARSAQAFARWLDCVTILKVPVKRAR